MTLLTHPERISEVRFLLGDPSTGVLSDTIIDRFVTREEATYGTAEDNQCIVLYQSVLNSLIYLTNKNVASSGGSASSTTKTKRREKVGQVEIEETYAEASASSKSVSSWVDQYEWFKKHPEFVCKSLRRGSASLVNISGVTKSDKEATYSDPDSFGNGYAENQNALDANYDRILKQNDDPYYYPRINLDDL